jgi:hypothetical protein
MSRIAMDKLRFSTSFGMVGLGVDRGLWATTARDVESVLDGSSVFVG